METKNPSVNKSYNHDKSISNSNCNRLNISGQNIISGKDFNILKYLNEMEQKKVTKEVFHRQNILPLLYPQTPKKSKYLNTSFDKNNISTLINEKSHKKDNDCFLTSLGNDKSKNSYSLTDKKKYKYSLKFTNSNRQKKLYEDKLINKNNIHLTAIIKEIRNKRDNKNLNDIAYDSKNMDCIIDMNNVINKHCKSKDWDLKEKEKNYDDFTINNKEMKLQNVIIKLMNKEKEKIDDLYKIHFKNIENKKNAIDEDENTFNQIKKEQKYNNRLLEENLNKLKGQNKILVYIIQGINDQLRKTEYEIMKKIYEIDELRVYAKFVKYIYGYDISNYESSIIEKDNSKGQEDINVLIKRVIDNYKECLIEGNNEIDTIEPDIVYNEIKLIEDRILLALKNKDKELDELKQSKKGNQVILNEIINKKNGLEKEYSYLKEESNNIIDLCSNENTEKDLFIVAQDFFNYIVNIFSNDNRYSFSYNYKDNNLSNSNSYNPFEISGLAEKSIKIIMEKEALLNEYILTNENYEREDPKTFSDVINSRKEQLILEKLQAAKKRIQNKEMIERKNIEKKSDKIYFIKRKMHQSIPKKKKKKIKIDPKVLKKLEDIDLLIYQ
jgi:hypothetical protein